VHGPALHRDERDQSLACRRQLDSLFTSVNGELTQELQREFFRHIMIVDPRWEDGMRSRLPVFLRRVVTGYWGGFSRKNSAALRMESWMGAGCQPSSRSALVPPYWRSTSNSSVATVELVRCSRRPGVPPRLGDIGAEESGRARQWQRKAGGNFEPPGSGLVTSWRG